MKKAYIFPGQGSQFPGMAEHLYNENEQAKAMFNKANKILGFDITEIMFRGTVEQLKQTDVTQPAIFLHSVILSKCLPDFNPDMVANFSASVHICSKFLLKNIPSSAIEALIPSFFVPIQHTVSSERNKLLNLL